MKIKDRLYGSFSKNDILGFGLIAVLCAAVLALLSFGLNHNRSKEAFVSSEAISTTPTVITTANTTLPTTSASVPVSQAESTTLTTQPVSTTQKAEPTSVPESTTTVPTTKGEPTKAEILKKVTDGINALKASDASYLGTKTQNIVINVTDCTYPAFLGVINSVIKAIANEEVLEYDFVNGRCMDPEGDTEIITNDAIPPAGSAFALTIDGVREAKVEKTGDNIRYTVTLVPETGTLQQPKPPHHGVACDTLDFSLFSIPMGEITKSEFNYPGATITVTYDKNGKVVGYSEHLDMDGVGEGKALGITASADLNGYIDESWVIVWK